MEVFWTGHVAAGGLPRRLPPHHVPLGPQRRSTLPALACFEIAQEQVHGVARGMCRRRKATRQHPRNAPGSGPEGRPKSPCAPAHPERRTPRHERHTRAMRLLGQCGRGELLQFWRLPALNPANVVEIAARDRRGGAPAGRVEESADPSAASFYADQNLLGPNTCERGCRNTCSRSQGYASRQAQAG